MKRLFIICFNLVLAAQALFSQTAPVTITGRITDATPGDPAVPVPVTVTGFNNIASFTLTMKFDTTKVRYVSSTTNPSLPGMTVSYTSPSGNTFGKLVFNWNGGANTSLADGSALANLVFHYVAGTGNLSWAYSFGAICQYKRLVETTLTILTDSPKYLYYKNGGVSDRSAPVAAAPEIDDPAVGPLSVPITVTGFTNIKAFTLYLEYDPALITYLNSFSKNPAFDSNFIVGDNPGSNGKRRLTFQWYGAVVNLAEGSTLCTFDFNYPVASCSSSLLSWYETGPTCEFTDSGENVLLDMPQEFHYLNGVVSSGLPSVWTGTVNGVWNDPGNWNACGIPDQAKNVIIPNVSPNTFPVITDTIYCKTIEIQPGAILTVSTDGMLVVGE
jgi:hypothetical protein